MFKEKYLKYKSKYLSLQKKINLEKFINLFKNYGGMANADLKYKNGKDRDVYLKKNVLNDELIIEVPLDLILTNIKGENAPIWRKKSNEMNNNIVGILYYMDKIKSDTHPFIRSYLNIFPESIEGMTCFWEEKYYQYLKNTSIYNHIINRNTSLKKSFKEINESLKPEYMLSFDDYLRYKSLVASRNFSFLKGDEKVRGLVPFGDMLNHDVNPNTRWGFDNTNNKFFFRATRNLSEGEVLTDTYGSKPSHQYLLHYGFFLPEKHKVLVNDKMVGINDKIEVTDLIKKQIIPKINLLEKDISLIKKLDQQKTCIKIIKNILETEKKILSRLI